MEVGSWCNTASPQVGSLPEPVGGAGSELGWLVTPCKPHDEDVDDSGEGADLASGSRPAVLRIHAPLRCILDGCVGRKLLGSKLVRLDPRWLRTAGRSLCGMISGIAPIATRPYIYQAIIAQVRFGVRDR